MIQTAALALLISPLGAIYDLAAWGHGQWGIGGMGSAYALPDSLDWAYGKSPLSFMLFARVKLI